ncbi:MAG: hypothetical protein WBW81_11205 [Methylocella sp.]
MALYRHFPDKTALLAAVADHGFETLRSSLTLAGELAHYQILFASHLRYKPFFALRLSPSAPMICGSLASRGGIHAPFVHGPRNPF